MNKVINFPKITNQTKTSEVSLNELTDQELISFLKVARALRDIGYAKNATVRILEQDLFIDVEYYSNLDESQHYTDASSTLTMSSGMDLFPTNHVDNMNDQDSANAMREMFKNLEVAI